MGAGAGGLRGYGEQQRRDVCALARGDRIHEVRLRPAYLPDFIKDCQHWGKPVRRLAISGQRLELDVQRQANQALERSIEQTKSLLELLANSQLLTNKKPAK